MKTGIHPTYHSPADIQCSNCGAVFNTGASKASIRVEICSKCHPFFTGKNTLIDTEGRVDKFMKQMESATGVKRKDRRKKTLEEKVNEQLAQQAAKDKK